MMKRAHVLFATVVVSMMFGQAAKSIAQQSTYVGVAE